MSQICAYARDRVNLSYSSVYDGLTTYMCIQNYLSTIIFTTVLHDCLTVLGIRDIPHEGCDYCINYCTHYLSVLGIRDIPHVGCDYCINYCTHYLTVLGIRDIHHVGCDYCINYCTHYLSALGIRDIPHVGCD